MFGVNPAILIFPQEHTAVPTSHNPSGQDQGILFDPSDEVPLIDVTAEFEPDVLVAL